MGCAGSRSKVEEAAEDVSMAFKSLPCHRFFSIPLGISILATLFLPFQLLMFIFLGLTKGLYVVWRLFALNFAKMGEHSRNAFRSAEGCGACFPFLNGYTFYFIITVLLCIIGIPFVILLYPIYGALHAIKMVGKQCFVESDMAEEARPDKGGIIANVIDRAGWTDTEKEKCAECFGEGYFGYITLVFGDWLTLTGMIEGCKAFMEGYEFHSGVFGTLATLLSNFSWLENLGVKDYVEFDVVPLKMLGTIMRKAVGLQYDSYAIKKGFASAMEWTQKSSMKKYRGCMGDFFAVIGIIFALACYSGAGVLAVLGIDGVLSLLGI